MRCGREFNRVRSIRLDVASDGINVGFDPARQLTLLKHACQLQNAVEPLQALAEARMAL